jgi:hypothetical protein
MDSAIECLRKALRVAPDYADAMFKANLLDWPITLPELEPSYALAEDKMGVTGTHSIPRLPGNNNFKVTPGISP